MRRCTSYLGTGALLFILALSPLFLHSYYITLLTKTLIFGMFAMSFNILLGYAGLPSLGHAAFFGTSGYIVGFLNLNKIIGVGGAAQFGMELLMGLASAAILASVFGLMILHTRGIYFLMVSLALSMMLWGVAYKWYDVTGGSDGIYGFSRPDLSSFLLNTSTNTGYFYLVLIFFIIAAILMHFIGSSSFGRALSGIRGNELRMRSLGYNVWFYLYVAFLFAGFFAGLSGILFAYYNYSVFPMNLDVITSTEVLLMTIVGGTGTSFGPLLGAGVLIFLKDFISTYTERWLMVLGVIYVLAIILLPEGIYGLIRKAFRK